MNQRGRPTRSRPLTPDSSRRAPALSPDAMPGVVVRAYGKFFTVQLANGRELLSTVSGLLKRERRGTDVVAVGDRVLVSDVGEGEGRIEFVEPRARSLSRLARHTNDVEQVILANPDQALFLFAVREPEPHTRLLDRFLVMAESRDLPALIGVNKIDLEAADPGGEAMSARARFGDYERLYPVHYLSAKNHSGLPQLKEALAGKITAVAGPSGVGKSSLLNALDPTRQRNVGEISAATGKGRHTTIATVLHRLPGEPETFVADTPGVRALSLQGVDPEELGYFFPEMRPYLGRCAFADCLHVTEPGCAVQSAVERGDISQKRYDSYVALRRGDTDDV